VPLEDLLLYCFDLALDGDDIEAAQALRQTVEKRKVAPRELLRALVKVDSQRTGFVNYKEFEKVLLKLCGGENYVSNDHLADIERYIDPQKEGKIDINFVTAMATVCGDVARAESKLKNLFKVLRVRGVDYRAAFTKEAGRYSQQIHVLHSTPKNQFLCNSFTAFDSLLSILHALCFINVTNAMQVIPQLTVLMHVHPFPTPHLCTPPNLLTPPRSRCQSHRGRRFPEHTLFELRAPYAQM
jgi:hypothetical protein